MKKGEVDYYVEIGEAILQQFKSNLTDPNYEVKVLVGEISSALRTLFANGYFPKKKLNDFVSSLHKLHLDISLLIENPLNGNFEIIIFEIKKVKSLGLAELSQLIGYCLVSKSKFGILLNIDNSVSKEFSLILDSDDDLTHIRRLIGNDLCEHFFGVMVWNSNTGNFEYVNSGIIKNMPQLVERVEKLIS